MNSCLNSRKKKVTLIFILQRNVSLNYVVFFKTGRVGGKTKL